MSASRNALAVILLGSTVVFGQAPYQPTTESLRTHKAPQWYEDAKFGIFIHWGPYAVPAYHEWYVEFISPKSNYGFLFGGPPFTATRGDLPQELFLAKTRADAVEYHKRNWGADFPYDNFLPMFKAEKFDPDAWAKLFREAGAGTLVGGAVLTETVFAWPGIGRLMYEALLQRDYNLLLGVFVVCSAMVLAFNLITDLVYRSVDPRIEFAS